MMRRAAILASLLAVSSAYAGGFYNGDPQPYGTRVATGMIPGHTYLRKFGEGAASDTEAIVAVGPTAAEAFPTAAETVDCVSTDADDTSAGAGLRSITIEGLDANWDVITESVDLAGLSTTAATTASFLRVYRATGNEVGTYGGSNQGTVTCSGVTSNDTKFEIPVDHGNTMLALYTVPAGFSLHIDKLRVMSEGNKLPTVHFVMRQNGGVNYPSRKIFALPQLDGVAEFSSNIPSVFPEKTDIYFTAVTASGTANVNAEFEGVIVAN